MLAVSKGNKELVEVLIAAKADVNAKKNSGLATLVSAAMADRMDIFSMLIAAGAHINIENEEEAVQIRAILKLLKKK